MKYILAIIFLILSYVSLAQTYNPAQGTVSNKPYAPGQAVPTDSRSYFYDATNFLWRPYQSTTEVISYLNLSKYRTGHFSIYVNPTGTLNGNGTFTGGNIVEYWFKNGTANGNLVAKLDTTKAWQQALVDTSSAIRSTVNTKQGALTLTTTGTSGASTLAGNTLNIPQYGGGGSVSITANTATGARVTPSPITGAGVISNDTFTIATRARLQKIVDSLDYYQDTLFVSNTFTSGVPLTFTNIDYDSIFVKRLVQGSGITLTQNTDSSVTVAVTTGGSESTTASNGLSLSGTDVILGGTALSANTAIPVSGYSLAINSTNTINALKVYNSGTGMALYSESSSGNAIYGAATTGIGIAGTNTSGSNPAGYFASAPTSTNTIISSLRVARQSTVGSSDGIGGAIDFYTQASDNIDYLSHSLASKWTTAANGTRTSMFEIYGVNSTTTARKLAISGVGKLTLDTYGVGTHTGTQTYNLMTDASGNVIEAALTSGAYEAKDTLTPATNFLPCYVKGVSTSFEKSNNVLKIGSVTNDYARTITINSMFYSTTSFSAATWTEVATIPSGFRPSGLVSFSIAEVIPGTASPSTTPIRGSDGTTGITDGCIYSGSAAYIDPDNGKIYVRIQTISAIATIDASNTVLLPIVVTYFINAGS